MLNANREKAANFKFKKLEVLIEKKYYIIYMFTNRRNINYGEIICNNIDNI